MAYSIQPLYSGENSAVKLPELDNLERSVQRRGEMQIRGAEMELEKSLKDKERMIKNLEVDPVSIANDVLMNRQALEIEKYNNEVAGIYKAKGTNLSTADEMKIASLRNNLRTKQDTLLAQGKMADDMLNSIQRDTRGYYDHEYAMDRYKKWLENPEENPLDATALQVAPQDIVSILGGEDPQSGFSESRRIEEKDGLGNVVGYQTVATEYKRTKEEAQERIFSLMQYEPVLKGVLRDFDNAPIAEQEAVLKDYDKNKNLRIDPDEFQYMNQHLNIRDNPIVKWAVNNQRYIAASMGGNPSTPKNIPQPRTGGGGFTLNIGGSDYKYTPPVPMATARFKEFYTFPNMKAIKVPVSAGRMFVGDVEMKLPMTSEATDLTLTGYSKDTDEFIFMTNDANNPLSGAANTEIAIPSANVIDRLKDLQVMYNGKPTPIKAIIGSPSSTTTASATPQVQSSGVQWKKTGK